MTSTENKQTETTATDKKPRILFQIVTYIIILQGAIGFLFFFSVNIIQLMHHELFEQISHDCNFKHLHLYTGLQMIFHISFIVAALLLRKKNILGFYMLVVSFFLVITTDYLLENTFILLNIILSSTLILVLSFYRKRLF